MLGAPSGPDTAIYARVALVVAALMAVGIPVATMMNASWFTPQAPTVVPAVVEPAQVRAPEPPAAPGPQKAPKPTVLARLAIPGPFEPVDAVTFSNRDVGQIQIDGLVGPRPEAVCADRAKVRWACGLRARAALNNALRNTALTCDVLERPEKRKVRARCRSQAGDIGKELVSKGWARPAPEREDEFRDELTAAQSARSGLWDGDWTVVLEGAAKAAKSRN